MWIGIAALVPILGSICHAQEAWVSLSDFEGSPRVWRSDGGGGPVVVVDDVSHGGGNSLAVDLIRLDGGRCVRATWRTDVDDVAWGPDSRIRFWLKGSSRALAPHGGAIFIEAGGRKGGGDSHWILPIEAAAYRSEDWVCVALGPLSAATNPEWAPDASGRPDYEAFRAVIFVAQQEGPDELNVPYTIHIDDVEALGVSMRELREFPAAIEERPGHITPIWRGFAGRERAHPTTITFGDVTGWRGAARGDGEVRLLRSEEEPCHEDLRYQAKVTYASQDGAGYFELLPPEPIAIEGRFNAACAWVYGNNWAWVPDPNTPAVDIWVRLVDSSGQHHRLNLGPVNFRFYGLLTKRLWERSSGDPRHLFYGGAADGVLHGPVSLEAVEIHGGSNREPRTIYIESIAFYQDGLTPPKLDEGLLRHLPFPTTKDTILPALARPAQVRLTRDGGAFVFTIEGDERIVYRYEPRTGNLSDLTVSVAGRAPFTPCAGAGPAFILDGATREPGSAEVMTTLVSTRAGREAVTTRWRVTAGSESAEYEITLTAKAKSLIVDWRSNDPCAEGLRLGRAEGLAKPRLIRVPYLAIYADRPQVLLDNDTFFITLLDWYNTGCSEFTSRAELVSDTSAIVNGGSAYNPLTDGTRNPLRERQFINVSSRFEEVLPTIPNPPSDQREALRAHLYTHLGGIAPDRFDTWLEMWRRYHALGIDNVFVTHHEDAWTNGADVGQGGQEYTMCTEAAPEVGDEKLIHYCHAMRRMGYYVGLYENFTDYNPLGRSWDERNAGRNSQGEMVRVWPPAYAINPIKAAEMARDYPRRVAAKFGCNTAYRDCHTAYPPWGQVDYRAGLPGAGMFSANFRAWGALLNDGSDAYGGPVFSEGLHHWFSAGLVDGSYGQINMTNPSEYPLLLDFDLRKIHPLGADISMTPGAAWGRGIWHGQAATIAYGHLGFLPVDSPEVAGRYYYYQLALQSRYIMEPVKEILYHSEGRLLTITEAIKQDALTSQVLIRYENGLEVAVNCNPSRRWQVTLGGRTYDLGTDSWAAVQGETFEECCTEQDGVRFGWVKCPDYTFVDGGGKVRDFGDVRTDGALVIRHAGGAREVIVIAEPTVTEWPRV